MRNDEYLNRLNPLRSKFIVSLSEEEESIARTINRQLTFCILNAGGLKMEMESSQLHSESLHGGTKGQLRAT